MKLNKFLLLAAVSKAQDASAASSPELAKLLQAMTPEQIQALMANVKIPDKDEQAPDTPDRINLEQPSDVDLDDSLRIIPGETPPAGDEEIQEVAETETQEGIIQPEVGPPEVGPPEVGSSEVGPPEVVASDAQSAIITQPTNQSVPAAPAIITASTVATSTLSTNTTTQAAPIEPVISALEPVEEIEPELSERLEDETQEDDRFNPVDEIQSDFAAEVPDENISLPLEGENLNSDEPEIEPASTTQDLIALDSMSAEEKNALLAKLLAAQSLQVTKQSADILQGQVSAGQSALQAAEETNPEAPMSDEVPPMMTGTNPAVYADTQQTADQPVNYPNEYGSRADPDTPELPVEDALPMEQQEPEVEPEPELITFETPKPVAPLDLKSNLGSDIRTSPEVSAPVSPELSELPESADITSESDIQSDIQEPASTITDSPHLPIDLKTANTDASDYETDEQFDEESIDMDEDESLEFDEDNDDNMEDEWDPYDDEYEDEYDEYEDGDYYEDEDAWGEVDEDDEDYSIQLDDDDEGNQEDFAEARNHYEAMYNSQNEESLEQREEEIFDEAMDEGKAGYNFAFFMILFISVFTGGYYAYGKIKDKFFPQSTDQKYALLPKDDGDVKQSASSNDKPEAENWDNDW